MNKKLTVVPVDTPMTRASHLTVCETCGKEYISHQQVEVAETWGPLYLWKICDGRYVKL